LEYAEYIKRTYRVGNKILHDKVYIGASVCKDQGLFRSKKRGGYFTFTNEKGFELANEPTLGERVRSNKQITLEFGDVWIVEQLSKQIGLCKIMEDICPESSDTLKTLVSFRMINPQEPWSYAEEWYEGSYAKILYPQAKVHSPRISEFHEFIGQEEKYVEFFGAYIELITQRDNISDKTTIPVLIDSTGLKNSIETHLTAINNHHGTISKEMRLIYVKDKKTNFPIYFRYVPDNIIDNSTLIQAINELSTYDIDIEFIIMDAGDYSKDILEQLNKNNIPFLIKMTRNSKEYKNLMAEYGNDLLEAENLVLYNDRKLFGKKVKFNLYGADVYAYIILDIAEYQNDIEQTVNNNMGKSDSITKINKGIEAAGRFILLSSVNFETSEILPLYYQRQAIEQFFDICKNNEGFVPIREHSEETIRGILLIEFIVTSLYTFLYQKLSGSPISPEAALRTLRRFKAEIRKNHILLEELTKRVKDIFDHLKLEYPYFIENGNVLEKTPCPVPNEKIKEKRGRPKGSKNKLEQGFRPITSLDHGERRQRGRPKGSKNK
jgi:hypothetical protein